MQKKEATDSANYAVRFGGVWLEYHERIECAERELATTKYLLDEVIAERDSLLAEKFILEKKFKDTIASLTQTETNHLELKQIVDQVRDEQKDVARRCLAAEAHSEWLEDQIKQLKVTRTIKEEEISSLVFRNDNLKSTVREGESVQDTLRQGIANRDTQITNLQNLLKSRDEEIVVQSRSLHSKDRQMALLVKERNAFKDDLTDTQRALALARRTSAVHRKSDITKTNTARCVTNAEPAHKGSDVVTPVNQGIERMGANTFNVDASIHITSCSTTQQGCGSHRTTSSPTDATTVLRKYKSSLQARSGAHAENGLESHSVLLEDILLSVLTPDVVDVNPTDAFANTDSTGTMDNHVTTTTTMSACMGMDVVRECMHVLTTPIAGRKSPLLDIDTTVPTAIHLNELDLDYIDGVLDTPGGSGDSGSAMKVDVCSDRLNNSEASVAALCPSVQKMLFAATSPVTCKPTTSDQPVRHSGYTSSIRGSRVGTSTTSSGGSGSGNTTNPWAVKSTIASNRTRCSVFTGPSSVDKAPTLCSNNTAPSARDRAVTDELGAYAARERDYKSALYLLQEEVRRLSVQVASFEAAKRTVRGTPKKNSAMTTTSSSLSSKHVAEYGAKSQMMSEQSGFGCRGKVLFV